MRAWVLAFLISLSPLPSLAQPAPAPAPATSPAQPAPAPAPATSPAPGAGNAPAPAPAAGARPRSEAQQAQQDRMRACNTEASARTLAADARRDFMRECLAGRMPPAPAAEAAPAAAPTQQDRMRRCNADATARNLSGEPRRSFMSSCLSGSPGATGRPSPPGNSATTYPNEAAARTGCADDTVVWGNSDTRVFHLAGSRFYGKTQDGAYLCRSSAELAGYRAAR